LSKNVNAIGFWNIQKRLVARFDGDPACVNESRVLRLPGVYHCKADPVMVACVKFAPEVRYIKAALDTDAPNAGKSTLLAINKGTA
jgi:putative DNA primase/helicase